MFGAIVEALVLMIVAAVLGGIIVWLLLRDRLTQAEADSQATDTLSNAEASKLKAQVDRYKKASEDCAAEQKDLKAASQAQVKALETELAEAKAALTAAQAQVVAATAAPAEKSQAEPLSQQAAAPGNKETEALERVKQRAAGLDFNRIGTASEAEKDDLKRVKGIGPFIERKLNALGIYTFRQIANFDEDLEDRVNDAIEFFPGRVRRDDWKGQAAQLAKEKKG
jgi:predicted flap endonuclease-1-like 5' DNA nuclease